MKRDITELAERIKALQKKAKLDELCKLMIEYGISIGDLVEYTNTYGSVIKTDAQRLREINQTRKRVRQIKQERQGYLEKARETKRAKKEALIQTAHTSQPRIDLGLDINLDGIDVNLDEETNDITEAT